MGIRCAADIIRGSKRGVVLTGAGISTPSGIPDFRSPTNGLWTRVDPFEVASLAAFRYHPERFFTWMHTLAITLSQAQPNQAHYGLARLEQAGYLQAVITQNIDTLHQKAGSKTVLEVHGSFSSMTCTWCFRKYAAEAYLQAYLESEQIPHCPVCQHVLKPDMVLFGEQLPAEIWLKALDASKKCDLMIVAGSSLEVLPVAGLPMRALENGAHLILINYSQTYLDVRADVVFHENVEEIIPGIVQSVLGE
ncbi:MAG: Sir2 family NAD-dependent protein deacetylase [Chloroflexota bacterium]